MARITSGASGHPRGQTNNNRRVPSTGACIRSKTPSLSNCTWNAVRVQWRRMPSRGQRFWRGPPGMAMRPLHNCYRRMAQLDGRAGTGPAAPPFSLVADHSLFGAADNPIHVLLAAFLRGECGRALVFAGLACAPLERVAVEVVDGVGGHALVFLGRPVRLGDVHVDVLGLFRRVNLDGAGHARLFLVVGETQGELVLGEL